VSRLGLDTPTNTGYSTSDFWHETNLQDWHVCELGQLGVESKAYTPGWYTPRESLLAAFDEHYLKIMGD
jgi:hypothetical protein